MMSSYNQPQIFDPVVMTAISALRKAPGVHVYLDAAQIDDTTTWVYSTVIDNFEKIPSGKLTYAFLMQAIIDNPAYSVGLIVPDDETVGLRMGHDGSTSFGTVMTCADTSCASNDWKWYQLTVGGALKAGDFFVHSVELTYPSTYKPYEAQVKFIGNGGTQTSIDQCFYFSPGVKELGKYVFNYEDSTDRVVILEHHFVYSGITEAMPRNPKIPMINVNDPRYLRLCDISAGGWAVIIGSYIAADPATDGIMIGYYQSKKNVHVFKEYKKKGVEVVFEITVSNFAISIATKDKRVLLQDDLVDDGWYSLIAQNINITNVEIHTGPKPH